MISRRGLIAGGLAATGVATTARLAGRYGLIPPDPGGIYGVGETLTYASQRLLTSGHSVAREFSRSQISRVLPVNGGVPAHAEFDQLRHGAFEDWRLDVEGLIARPGSFSLPDLKRLPQTSQITLLACEEGWSYIGEWTGVRLADLLNLMGVQPSAKYVVFFPYDDNWDSLDLADAWHPQTLLAYGLNGRELPAEHGAPLRLRVPRQLGYKSVKYLSHMLVTDTLKDIGKGLGSISPEIGYSWYAGI